MDYLREGILWSRLVLVCALLQTNYVGVVVVVVVVVPNNNNNNNNSKACWRYFLLLPNVLYFSYIFCSMLFKGVSPALLSLTPLDLLHITWFVFILFSASCFAVHACLMQLT